MTPGRRPRVCLPHSSVVTATRVPTRFVSKYTVTARLCTGRRRPPSPAVGSGVGYRLSTNGQNPPVALWFPMPVMLPGREQAPGIPPKDLDKRGCNWLPPPRRPRAVRAGL